MIESLISIAFYLSTAITALILLLPSQYGQSTTEKEDDGRGPSQKPKMTVQILVLGDIGRSPRMQYHALSIAKHGGQVDIIGYNESEPHPDILSHPGISIVPLPPHPAALQTSNKLLFLAFGPLKNPPSIPSLAVASLVCFLRNTSLIIDWHNFGYSILALKLGTGHPLTQLSKWYERTFCKYATAHICVTQAMVSILKKDFALKAPLLPLHDRPASHFQPIPDNHARREFLVSLPEAQSVRECLESGNVQVVVSSTSWTPDEDFSILIDALCQYSEFASTTKPYLPQILAIITGKGPQKDMYLEKISCLEAAGKLKKATIRTAWLSVSDYAQLLASASLGVSLHTSSSGVDLPMKVVDMFGAGLPVAGWSRFEAWPELVTEGVNGMGFGSSGELSAILVDLLGNPNKLEKLRAGAERESSRRWDDEWDPVAGKLLRLI
ncbi:mannosyltransferase [Monascus purpureus]|uniref:Chitobiosyldiphosphodolichol beta-mannosyltransferase n=1 Tax=Monascus purpureus TaxID=5098 RepID=A0A507QUA6_MONPU|nr:mannosyltransferase [Monascus purpureus]